MPLKPPHVTKIPGYSRGATSVTGDPKKLATHVRTELEKLERNQPNTDTIRIFDDYSVGPHDRTILVDMQLKVLITIQLPPATHRFALPVVIVKTDSPFFPFPGAPPEIGAVLVKPAAGDKINNSFEGILWIDKFVAYSMHPDGIDTWWLEGSQKGVILIGGGGGGGGGAVVEAITEADIQLSDVTVLDVSTTMHGLAPKLTGDATQYLDATGHYTTPAPDFAAAFLLMGG